MVFLVHAVSLALVAGQTTQCQKPDGTKGPCGPGNDLCHSPGCKFPLHPNKRHHSALVYCL